MNFTKTETRLMEAMSSMDVIDCHEHLPPEQDRLAAPQDVFTLFSHYTRHDLLSAGMDRSSDDVSPWSPDRPAYNSLFDTKIPLEKRWETFRPFWWRIRHGSYARAALLTAKMVYGIEDISDDTYQELSKRIAAENTPGIYTRMLCERCRIKAALTQCGRTEVGRPLVPVMPGMGLIPFASPAAMEAASAEFGVKISTPEDCLALIRKKLTKWIAEGAVGIKVFSKPTTAPNAKEAEDSLRKLLNGQKAQADARGIEPLDNYLLHNTIDIAAEMNLVVATHAGIWGDFRDLDCKHMLALAPAHPRANFDLYHLGMPSVRDAIVVAKNLPNVFLNLAWTHIISQVQTRSGIDELLDQVPINKVLAFGGDYGRPVEKVVGHLHMAREDFAIVFGGRIDLGLMSFDEAVQLLKLWFWDNPLALYSRLKV